MALSQLDRSSVAERADGRKLKVLTLVERVGEYGGAERLAAQIAMRLDHERFERILCASRWSSTERANGEARAAVSDLERAGVRFVGLDRAARHQLWAWRPLISILREERVDIVHAHMFGSNFWAAVLGRLTKVPVVVAHEHGWSYEGQPLRRLVDRRVIASRADAFIAVSREDRRRMIEVEGIEPEDIVFVPNGISIEARPSGRSSMRSKLGIEEGAPVVGVVSFLSPLKALDVLVRAAATLAPKLPGLKVMIVGDGTERPQLESLIGELGLEETVVMLGFRNDVPELLDGFDVAVCCSDSEGSPLSVMEYMEAALPVVATRVGGLPDLIDDGVHGLLVERRDLAGLATAIEALLRDPMRAAEMGQRGRERRRLEFELEPMVKTIEALYLDLHTSAKAGAETA